MKENGRLWQKLKRRKETVLCMRSELQAQWLPSSMAGSAVDQERDMKKVTVK